MSDENWRQYLFTAEDKLNELTTDQIATTAKILALLLGKYGLEFGDFAEEVYRELIEMEEMTEEAKEIFKQGIKRLRSTNANKEIV